MSQHRRTNVTTWRRRALLLTCAILAEPALHAQHADFRVKGRVVTERGEPIDKAVVRAEAFFGYAAGTFAGPRKYDAETDRKGQWSIGAMQPGIWLFDVSAPGYLPETVALPIRILTTVSMGTSGLALTWDLILKPAHAPEGVTGDLLTQAATAARDAKADEVRSTLQNIPEDPDAEFLAGAGRVAILARELPLARALFLRAIERDPSSYRATLGIASIFLLERDFDSASRAFDAARSRTHDKDEQKFINAALGDLATIKVR